MRLDVEARGAEGAAQGSEARHRQLEQHLLSRPLPRLKPEATVLHLLLWPITIRNCLFTLFRIEEAARD